MVVGGKEGLGTNLVVDVLDDRLGQGHTVIGSRSPSQLIKEDERPICRQTDRLIGLHHFDHESRLTTNQVVCRPNSGENSIENR